MAISCQDPTEKDLPRCAYEVVRDCILNDLGQPCKVGTDEDVCQDIFYGYDGPYKPGDKIVDPKPPTYLPYCDTDAGKKATGCFDRKDIDQVTGSYSCNDGIQKADYHDCKDITKKSDSSQPKPTPSTTPPSNNGNGRPCENGFTNIGMNLNIICERIKECNVPFYMTCEKKHNSDDEKTKVVHKTTVIRGASASASATATATANAAEVSSCRLDGSADGILQKFDSIKYQACGLYTNGDKAYSDGFVMGCTKIGYTQLICQSLVDSSILNTKTQPTQTATQPQTQSNTQSTTQPTQTPQTTQTQSTTQPTQAIQPAPVG